MASIGCLIKNFIRTYFSPAIFGKSLTYSEKPSADVRREGEREPFCNYARDREMEEEEEEENPTFPS